MVLKSISRESCVDGIDEYVYFGGDYTRHKAWDKIV